MNLSREKKVIVNLILEVLGRPPEHLKETLEKLLEGIKKEKGVLSLNSKTIKEPVLVKDQNNLYVSFADFEIEIESLVTLTFIVFKYMPAHIEVVYPEKLSLSNNEWNMVLNEITRKIHTYDEVTRVVQMQNNMLQEKIKELKEGKK